MGEPQFDETTISILDGPTFEFVPALGVSGFTQIELIKGRSLMDTERDREMVWHRHSFAEAVSGPYDTILFSIPFGMKAVSGSG